MYTLSYSETIRPDPAEITGKTYTYVMNGHIAFQYGHPSVNLNVLMRFWIRAHLKSMLKWRDFDSEIFGREILEHIAGKLREWLKDEPSKISVYKWQMWFRMGGYAHQVTWDRDWENGC